MYHFLSSAEASIVQFWPSLCQERYAVSLALRHGERARLARLKLPRKGAAETEKREGEIERLEGITKREKASLLLLSSQCLRILYISRSYISQAIS